jgi:hypothetical protein
MSVPLPISRQTKAKERFYPGEVAHNRGKHDWQT